MRTDAVVAVVLINGDELEFGAIDTRSFRCGGVLRKQISFQLGSFSTIKA